MAKKVYKSTSGKRGSLLEVAQDPDYGKDTRGNAKKKVYMYNAKGELVDTDKLKNSLKSPDLKEEHPEVVGAKLYNEKLTKLEEQYTGINLMPSTLIIRLRRSINMVGGLWIPDQIKKPLPSGLDGVNKEDTQDNPFPFDNYGVIVNVAENIKKEYPFITPGKFAQVTPKVKDIGYNRERMLYVPGTYHFQHYNDKRDPKESGYIKVKVFDIDFVE